MINIKGDYFGSVVVWKNGITLLGSLECVYPKRKGGRELKILGNKNQLLG